MVDTRRAENDDQRRLEGQRNLVEEAYDTEFAWDGGDPGDSDDLGYMYDPNVLLVRSDDPDLVATVVASLNGTGDFGADVVEEPLDTESRDREPLAVSRLRLPPRLDDDPRRVPLALEVLDGVPVNTETETFVSPEHFLHLSGPGSGRLCPATEPAETGRDEPWPELVQPRTRGQGARVVVVDSGWHPPAASQATTSGWLRGVTGDDEQNGPVLGPYAGHGTFIAGVVRCLAPAAEVYVERFLGRGGAIREGDMVLQLRRALDRDPHLINLSAGATTRQNRPLLSFERFWAQDLSGRDNCLLVAAAGNDATKDHFWPAAFSWALGVGSVDRDGEISSFSNWGTTADVFALGRNLVNAYPDGTYVCREAPDQGDVRVFTTGLARWSGTSFAAPVVGGLIADALAASGYDVHVARQSVLAAATPGADPDGGPVAVLAAPYL